MVDQLTVRAGLSCQSWSPRVVWLLCGACSLLAAADAQIEGSVARVLQTIAEVVDDAVGTEQKTFDDLYADFVSRMEFEVFQDDPIDAIANTKHMENKYEHSPGKAVDLIATSKTLASVLPEFEASWHGADAWWQAILIMRDRAFLDGKKSMPWLFVAIYLLWLPAGILYERWQGQTSVASEVGASTKPANTQAASSSRVQAWDVMRLFLVTCATVEHSYNLLYPPASLHDHNSAATHWFVEVMMSGFAFVSGVFGGNVSLDSMARTICYCAGANVISAGLSLIPFSIYFGTDIVGTWLQTFYFWGCHKWYLWALLGWRFMISPLHASLTKRQIPGAGIAVLVFVVLISYAGCQLTGPMFAVGTDCELEVMPPWSCGLEESPAVNPMEKPQCAELLPRGQALDKAFSFVLNKSRLRFLWVSYWYYAPIYTLGLVVPRATWNDYFNKTFVQQVAAIFIVAWYLLQAAIQQLGEWNVSACFFADQCLFCMPFPSEIAYATDHWHGIAFFSWDCFQKSVVTIGFLICIAGACALGEAHLPRAVDILAESGSRSLYIYVLHWDVLQFAFLCGTWQLTNAVPSSVRLTFTWLVAWHLSFSLSTSLTERCFHWAVYPYWMKDGVQRLLGVLGVAPSSQQARTAEVKYESLSKNPDAEAANAAAAAAAQDSSKSSTSFLSCGAGRFAKCGTRA
eukprot:TRINITY_DN36084_c0_g2_i1.p1 TRINITY_DN36084_c0_g2~~TRINITY_DN36084_c0_g2_i1.p1  ORF type:complete len:686 (+),score=69.96 TRINITY_DN36084_c0_g2_i1:64-2121(+)